MANIVRYNPFNEVVSLREAMDHLFEDSFFQRGVSGSRGLASNLYETTEGFVLQIPMPGTTSEKVEITAQENTLTIKWETSIQTPEKASAHWQGLKAGKFQQSFTLPTAINAETAEATYEGGILTLRLPKAEHARARTVKVTARN